MINLYQYSETLYFKILNRPLWLGIFLLLFGFMESSAQSVDTLKIYNWYESAYVLLGKNTGQADSLIRLGLRYAQEIHYQHGLTDGLFLQGCLYDQQGENDQAIQKLEQALDLYQRQPYYKRFLIETYGRLGLLYNKKGQNNQGLDHLLKGLELAENLNDMPNRVRLLIVLAMHHNDYTRYYDRALEYLQEAEDLAERLKDKDRLGQIYLQKGISYRYKGKVEKALHFCRLAAATFEKTGSDFNRLRALLVEAGVFIDHQYPQEVVPLISSIDSLAILVKNWQIKGNVAFLKAQLSYEQNHYGQAASYADSALKAFVTGGDVQNQLEVKKLQARLYLLQGSKAKGDSLLYAINQEIDSNYTLQITRNDAEMRQKYQNQKRVKELELKEKTLRLASQQRWILLGCVLLLIALGVIYYRRYRDNRKSAELLNRKNLEIEQQNALLQQTNAQNELLLREIHHRVKNNLQLATSLLNMQLRSTLTEDAVSALKESASRLQSMLLVHQELYDKDHVGLVDMGTYTHNLTEYLAQSYGQLHKQVLPALYIQDISFTVQVAIPLGLILTELITNSMKYARPLQHFLQIEIDLHHMKEQQYCLYYSDNGQGLPPELDIMTGKSMGIRLIRDLTKQLRGTLHYEYRNAAIFVINFKS